MSSVRRAKIVANKQDSEENKLYAVCCYLLFFIVVPLLSDEAKRSPFVLFHLNQGLVLLLAWLSIVVILIIPFLGWVIGAIGGLIVFAFSVMGVVSALQGEMRKIPFIGDIELIN